MSELPDPLPIAGGLTASANGRRLAVVGQHSVAVVDVGPGSSLSARGPAQVIDSCWCGATPQDALELPEPEPSDAAFSPDGTELFVSGDFDTAIYSLAEGVVQTLYAQDGFTQSAAWSGNGRVLAAGAGYLGIDVSSSSSRLVDLLRGSGGSPFNAIALTAGGMLAGGAQDGTVRVWAADPDLWNMSIRTPADDDLDHAYAAPGANVTAVGDARTGVFLVDPGGKLVRTPRPYGAPRSAYQQPKPRSCR